MLTEEQYKQLCEDAESMRVYDGRGTFDLYECQHTMCDSNGTLKIERGCGYWMVSTYRDKGVTPFAMVCPHCRGTMSHTRTFKQIPDDIEPEQWIRPTYEQYKELSVYTQNHIENGGLILESELMETEIEPDPASYFDECREAMGQVSKSMKEFADAFNEYIVGTLEELAVREVNRTADEVYEIRKLENYCRIHELDSKPYDVHAAKNPLMKGRLRKGHSIKNQWKRIRSNPKLR